MTSTSTNKRLHHFDLLRLFLVLLALMSHFLLSQHVSRPGLITIVIRSATPALLIIFGFMMEHVYARRWVVKGPRVILERMLGRAVLCYLAFAAIVLVVFLNGDIPFTRFLGNILLLMPGHPHADIFKYYALLLPATFFLMWVRFTFGWRHKLFLVLLLVALAETGQFFIHVIPSPFQYLGSFFLGLNDTVGPSIIHSLVLIVFGELVASYTSGGSAPLQKQVLVCMGLISVGAVVQEIEGAGLSHFIIALARYNGYRAHNSYIYYAYGIVTFMLYAACSWLAVLRFPSSLKQKISYYGGNTFIIFFYGNVIVLLTPAISHSLLSLALAWVATAILSLATVNVFEWAEQRFVVIQVFNNWLGGAVHRVLLSSRSVIYLTGALKRQNAKVQQLVPQDEEPEKVLVSN
ncbi:hypothetical protein [Pontibacter chitinilyticus]|uniref:hypothetical protein n=1 Tax=Pontibacter chitinilyticus TaxID=2674989 RepID=UPI00321BBDE2